MSGTSGHLLSSGPVRQLEALQFGPGGRAPRSAPARSRGRARRTTTAQTRGRVVGQLRNCSCWRSRGSAGIWTGTAEESVSLPSQCAAQRIGFDFRVAATSPVRVSRERSCQVRTRVVAPCRYAVATSARAERHLGAVAGIHTSRVRAAWRFARAKNPLGAVVPVRAERCPGTVVPTRCVSAARARAGRHLGESREGAHGCARAGAPDLTLAPARSPSPSRESARQGQASVRVYL